PRAAADEAAAGRKAGPAAHDWRRRGAHHQPRHRADDPDGGRCSGPGRDARAPPAARRRSGGRARKRVLGRGLRRERPPVGPHTRVEADHRHPRNTRRPAPRAPCSPGSCTTESPPPANNAAWWRPNRCCSRSCAPRSGGRISRRAPTRARVPRPTSTASPRTGCGRWATSTDAGTVGARLLVIGLDGATFDLVAPWAAFPGWTSLVTGVNPGRHGVLDFVERVPGTFRVRFVNGSRRRTPALWTRLSAAGRRVAVLGGPGKYPPGPVKGVMVSGFDSPVTTGIDGSFVFPRAFHAEMRRLVGRLPFADFQEVRTGPGWHERALARLLDGVARRAALARASVRRQPWDALMVVFGEPDTVAHHFWRFHDPASPRYAASPHANAIRHVYRALDAAVERLTTAAGDACVAVVSDHGSGGASDRVVHLNRYLEQQGFLGFRPRGGAVPRVMRGLALRAVPVRFQGTLVRRAPAAAGRLEGGARFRAIDWSRPQAYSEELDYHPSVWINVAGREPEGIVGAARYERTRDAVAAALAAWRGDGGRGGVGGGRGGGGG